MFVQLDTLKNSWQRRGTVFAALKIIPLSRTSLMQQDNQQLAAEVKALKTGLDEVEARAREELGMVKPGETFYLVVDETP